MEHNCNNDLLRLALNLGYLNGYVRHDYGAKDVYLIRSGTSDAYKIGYSGNPSFRVAALQTGSYQDLKLVFDCSGDSQIETLLHRRYNNHKIRGEWFTFSEIEVNDVISDMNVFNYINLEDGRYIFPFIYSSVDDVHVSVIKGLEDPRLNITHEIFKLNVITRYANIIKDDFEIIYRKGMKYDINGIKNAIDRAINAGQDLNSQISIYNNIIDHFPSFDDVDYPDLSHVEDLIRWLFSLNKFKIMSDIRAGKIILDGPVYQTIDTAPNSQSQPDNNHATYYTLKRLQHRDTKGEEYIYNLIKTILTTSGVVVFSPEKRTRLWQLHSMINRVNGRSFTNGQGTMRYMTQFIKDHPQYAITTNITFKGITYVGIGLFKETPDELDARKDNLIWYNNPIINNPPKTDFNQICMSICEKTNWTQSQYNKICNLKLITFLYNGKDYNLDATVKVTEANIVRYIYDNIAKLRTVSASALTMKTKFKSAIVMDLDLSIQYDVPQYNNMLHAANEASIFKEELEDMIAQFNNNIEALPRIDTIVYPDFDVLLSLIEWLQNLGTSETDMHSHMETYMRDNLVEPTLRIVRQKPVAKSQAPTKYLEISVTS